MSNGDLYDRLDSEEDLSDEEKRELYFSLYNPLEDEDED